MRSCEPQVEPPRQRTGNYAHAVVPPSVAANAVGRSLELLGDPGVNVLNLNLALDHLSAR